MGDPLLLHVSRPVAGWHQGVIVRYGITINVRRAVNVGSRKVGTRKVGAGNIVAF